VPRLDPRHRLLLVLSELCIDLNDVFFSTQSTLSEGVDRPIEIGRSSRPRWDILTAAGRLDMSRESGRC
jgi:hypothetical protein